MRLRVSAEGLQRQPRAVHEAAVQEPCVGPRVRLQRLDHAGALLPGPASELSTHAVRVLGQQGDPLWTEKV